MKSFRTCAIFLLIAFVVANDGLYFSAPVLLPIPAAHPPLPKPEVSPIILVLAVCVIPFVLIEMPGFLVTGILFSSVTFSFPDSARILIFLFIPAAINAAFYAWIIPHLVRFFRYLWFATLPKDMRELERDLFYRDKNV